MFTTREICFIGIFVAIIALCAQISIPLGPMPFTLQTFAVFLAGIVLGAKKGFVAALVYILLGAIGLPVFSLFRGGLGMIFGAAGGFILSFPLMAVLSAKGVFGLFVAMILNLSFGMLWFSFFSQNIISEAFVLVVLPFILPEIFKIFAAMLLGKSLKIALVKARILFQE